jgi:tetratricopeptide (TPR) repeat protein
VLRHEPGGGPDAVKQAARVAAAGWVVRGTYQRSGKRLRVLADVYRADGSNIGTTGHLDGDDSDLFGVQDRVVHEVLELLHAEARIQRRARVARAGTRNQQAYQAFMEAMLLSPSESERRLELLERAVAADPDYASARCQLFAQHIVEHDYGGGGEAALARATTEARAVCRLDADAQCCVVARARVAARSGRYREALTTVEQVAPRTWSTPGMLWFLAETVYGDPLNGLTLCSLERAEALLRRVIELEPGHNWARNNLAILLIYRGDFAEAVEVLGESVALEDELNELGERSRLARLGRGGPVFFARTIRGVAELRRGRVEAAEEDLRVALARVETSGNHGGFMALEHLAWTALREVAARRGDEVARAAADRSRAVTATAATNGSSDPAEALRLVASLALLASNETALSALDRALALAPSRTTLHRSRAVVLERIGRHAEAEGAIARAIELAEQGSDDAWLSQRFRGCLRQTTASAVGAQEPLRP